MTREDVIRMAEEAGLERVVRVHDDGTQIVELLDPELLERFAALVAAAEREACARLVERQWETVGTQRRTAERCAAAIRARGDE